MVNEEQMSGGGESSSLVVPRDGLDHPAEGEEGRTTTALSGHPLHVGMPPRGPGAHQGPPRPAPGPCPRSAQGIHSGPASALGLEVACSGVGGRGWTGGWTAENPELAEEPSIGRGGTRASENLSTPHSTVLENRNI